MILTLDEEVNLPAALASCAGWCGDVQTADSGFTGALATAESGPANVPHHAFENFGEQHPLSSGLNELNGRRS